MIALMIQTRLHVINMSQLLCLMFLRLMLKSQRLPPNSNWTLTRNLLNTSINQNITVTERVIMTITINITTSIKKEKNLELMQKLWLNPQPNPLLKLLLRPKKSTSVTFLTNLSVLSQLKKTWPLLWMLSQELLIKLTTAKLWKSPPDLRHPHLE